MKKSLRVATVLLGLGLALGCISSVAAQRRLGGYRDVSKDDAEVQAAAEFAVKHQGEKEERTIRLVSVEHAEVQVVAGINYRLCLKVEFHDTDKDEDVTKTVRAVVYRNLQKEYSLTSWEDEDCGGAGEIEER
jgi:aspartic proteinase inhibitor